MKMGYVFKLDGTQMNTEFTDFYAKESVPICVNPCPNWMGHR